MTLGEVLFSRFRWYRRWRGGHWEKWWIMPPVASTMWLQGEHGTRPLGGGILDECEDYVPPHALPGAGPYRSSHPIGGAK